LAYTLKARLFLHTAEVVGTAAYDSALASALNGISAPANDYNAYHSLVQSENNLWYQFTGAWVDYLSAGQALVDLMSARADSVLRPQYFNLNSADEYRGALPGDVFVDTISTLSDARLAPDFQQPLVTWTENQLIIAEAAYRTGDEPTAQTALVAVRTNAGVTNPDYGGSPPTGAALLSEIMLEKYIALFQSPESWNDYKRTCLPALVPANGISLPGRYKYPTDESDNNPNTPADPQRNWNDPNACP
jgi:starch-binding outer membrane protein, SusD/RagB family